jgi:plastocyanin
VGVGVLALVPAAAQARTKTVTMGLSAKESKSFNAIGTDVNDFFPHGVRIHAGDKVKFMPPAGAPHTVNIPKKGEDPAGFIVPDGATISGVNDAANQPFWFNGRPELNFNFALLKNVFGKKVTFNSKKGFQSGVALGPAKPFTLKFPKAGHFTYFCNVHPGMKGTVTVVGKSKRIPSAKADRTALKRQINRDRKIAKKLANANVPAGTVDVGSAGPHGVEYFGMVPGNLTVHVGNPVNFRMTALSFEDHTATFGPDDPSNPNGYLGTIASSFEGNKLDQRGVYPSEPPGQPPITLTPATHGNGFWNTGALDASNATTTVPASNSVIFGAPGTYNYYCMIHPFMHGVITVTP